MISYKLIMWFTHNVKMPAPERKKKDYVFMKKSRIPYEFGVTVSEKILSARKVKRYHLYLHNG